MQSLGMQTRTDVALSLMGIFPLETEIEFRKLTLSANSVELIHVHG